MTVVRESLGSKPAESVDRCATKPVRMADRMQPKDLSDSKKPAAIQGFLERDFNQCFEEKRRYENAAWDVTKFMFSAYSAILAVVLGGYQFSPASGADLKPLAVLLLSVGFLVGVFTLLMVVRNRVYFVIVTRYINEHRSFFLSQRPLGFENASQMFMNPDLPPFFSRNSTQSWAALLIATLNSIAVGALTFILSSASVGWTVVAVTSTIVLQMTLAITYLKSREDKSADVAAFGAF